MKSTKLAIILSHPIQYYSPLFKEMAGRELIELKVFYTWSQAKEKLFDEKFGRTIQWDIPLLSGYEYEFVKNISPNPGSQNFKGLINPGLNKAIEQWGATHLLVFGWNHDSHLKAMRYFKGKIPVYFRGDSTLLDEKGGWKVTARRMALRYIYRSIDHAFYVGKNNKAYFRKHGIKGKELIFAPHAIDNERFYETKDVKYHKASDQIKKRLALPDDQVIVLFVGKFEEKKDPMILIKAAGKMPDISFVFVGNGALEDAMKEQSKALGNVYYLPFQNQSKMPEIYRIADIYCLPSKGPGETWGLAVNESMACGIPVITSDKVGCAPDLVIEGKTGYIFESQNREDLIEKIRMAASHHNELGHHALQHIRSFDMKTLADAILTPFMS